jgi:hypothetical protein
MIGVIFTHLPMMQLADARVLGREIRSGQTTLGLAHLAVQRFAEESTRVLGTVLNGWDPRSSGGTDYTFSYREYAQQYHSSPCNRSMQEQLN